MSKHITFENTSEGSALISDLIQLLNIQSVEDVAAPNAPFGIAVDEALTYMLDLGEKYGFKTYNVDHYAGYIEFGEGREMLGILCHLDVVPAGEDWHEEPFNARVVDGKLYGRGSFDDKGPAMTVLYAMKRLKDRGFIPNKRIRLILGTNEESGSACMDYYMKHEEIPTLAFSPDADFPVIHGEMGIVICQIGKTFTDKLEDGGIKLLSFKGGNAPNMVPDSAEVIIKDTRPVLEIIEAFNISRDANLSYRRLEDGSLAIRSKGISAHGSTPEKGVNAITDLLAFMDLIDLEIGDSANFVRFFNRVIGKELHGESFNLNFVDAYNTLVLNLGMIDMNVDSGSVTINVRYPITYKEENVRKGIEKTLSGTGLTIKAWRNASPLFFEKNDPLVQDLMAVYKEVTGDLEAEPITIGGGTYARSMPNAVAFGAMFSDSEDRMHQSDEYITTVDLSKLTDIYEKAIEKLTSR